jgi:hypothetical protein
MKKQIDENASKEKLNLYSQQRGIRSTKVEFLASHVF